jgi:hypothetical protein
MKISWSQAAAWRMRQHYLDRRAPSTSLLKVASRLCGLHAQLLSSAELSAWARIANLDRSALRRALWDDRSLVKTWAMRGTLHLLPASEYAMWSAALATSPRYLRERQWKKHFGLSLDDLERLNETAGTVLEGRLLTRECTGRGGCGRAGRCAVCGKNRGEQLGNRAETGGIHRAPVLWSECRIASAVYKPEDVAGGVSASSRSGDSNARGHASILARICAGDLSRLGALVGGYDGDHPSMD